MFTRSRFNYVVSFANRYHNTGDIYLHLKIIILLVEIDKYPTKG